MTDRPILFSGPMVRALLEGRKTQTRRVINPQPDGSGWQSSRQLPDGTWQVGPASRMNIYKTVKVPLTVGDRFWVREGFAVSGIGWGKKPSQAIGGRVHYRADPDHGWHDYWGSWRPSIHMPRWASRLTLTVTDVRVQRVQDISEADAWAEGCRRGDAWDNGKGYFPAEERDPSGIGFVGWDDAREWFADLWNHLNGPRGYGWDANPWVAGYTFTVERRNIDQAEAA